MGPRRAGGGLQATISGKIAMTAHEALPAHYNVLLNREARVDLGLLVKEHWDKVALAFGGLWIFIQWLFGRKDKAREVKLTETRGLDEIARAGVNLAFSSMKSEIERLSGEVSELNARVGTMQQEFTQTLIAKDADLRALQGENRQLRAENEALSRTMQRWAEMMEAAGMERPPIPKTFLALEIGAGGDIGTMGAMQP
jgi:cell division protein FtsB